MITPVPMCRVSIIGSKSILDDTVDILHSLKVIHIDDYKAGKDASMEGYFDIGNPFERASKISDLLVNVRIVMNNLGIKSGEAEKIKIPSNAEKKFEHIKNEFEKLTEKDKEIGRDIDRLKPIETPVKFLTALGIRPDLLQPTEELELITGIIDKDPEPAIKKVTNKYEIFTGDLDNMVAFAVFCPTKEVSSIQDALSELNYTEMPIPEEELEFKNIEDLNLKREWLKKELENVREHINKIKTNEGHFLASYEDDLSGECEKAEAPLKFATSRNSFIIDGWMPEKKFKKAKKMLESRTTGKIYIERSKDVVEWVPTELKNPKIVDSFEFFINLYSLPMYKEIDPTFIVFLTFPLFFGFMLGDVGYGIATLAIFYLVGKKMTGPVKGLMNALMLASVATIGFGFFFAEFFGYLMYTPVINREHDIGLMLLISILVGIVHVTIGFLLNFANAIRNHGIKKAIFEGGSWLVLEAGALLLTAHMLEKLTLPYLQEISIGIMLIGTVMLFKGHGALGLIEIPAVVSNVLSYARLFAIGLASVALAVIMNDMAGAMIQKGLLWFPLAIMILVMGHLLNIGIGILGGFLQSLRLHYVEFFTKFYKGGGRRYEPFGA